MAVADNVALMKRWFDEVWNQGRIETISELMAEDAIASGQGGSGVGLRGPAEFIPFVQRLRAAFPDIHIAVEDAFGEGEKVVVRWSADMTHTGADLGIAASQRKVHLTGITIAQIQKGKIVSGWDNWDQFAMMSQIGAISETHESNLPPSTPKHHAAS